VAYVVQEVVLDAETGTLEVDELVLEAQSDHEP